MITALFYLAGLGNIVGMLALCSKDILRLFEGYLGLLQGTGISGGLVGAEMTLPNIYPTVFSPEGCFCVILWGLAYIGCAKKYRQMPLLCLVFCLETVFYTLTWIDWNHANTLRLAQITKESPLIGSFFANYGLFDGACAAMFFFAFLIAVTSSEPKVKTQ